MNMYVCTIVTGSEGVWARKWRWTQALQWENCMGMDGVKFLECFSTAQSVCIIIAEHIHIYHIPCIKRNSKFISEHLRTLATSMTARPPSLLKITSIAVIILIAISLYNSNFFSIPSSPTMPPKPKLNVHSFPRPPLLEKTPRHLQIKWHDQIIADTKDAYWVLETTHPPST